MTPDAAPAVAAVKAVLAALPCVQAGWASGVPADGQDDWLHMAAIAAVEAAAPHIRAHERERFAAELLQLTAELRKDHHDH